MISITISEHICMRYIERFNQNLNSVTDHNERLRLAESGIKTILSDAKYVSDNKDGVLLHSKMFNCNLIIRNRVLVTLYKPDPKIRFREGRRKVYDHP